MATTITLYIGDVRDVMAQLPDNGFGLLVTSPPFLALRSYLPADHPDKHREIGSEPTPATFLDTLYGLTAEWGRLVPEWGSICVELGDTMSGSGGAGGDYNADGLRAGQPRFRQGYVAVGADGKPHDKGRREPYDVGYQTRPTGGPNWPLAKSMCLLPSLYPAGLAYGHHPLTGQPHDAGQWRIRNLIVWARPNPPVGSLGKRNPTTRTGDQKFRPATSYITVACRGSGRYFDLDAVRTDYQESTLKQHKNSPNGTINGPGHEHEHGTKFAKAKLTNAGAPPLDWHQDVDGDWLWKLATAPYKGAHYATYPLTLPRRLILAMCPERVCRECGWPSERISGITDEYAQALIDSNGGRGRGDLGDDPNVRPTGGTWLKPVRESTTLGWTDCGHNAWRTGHVLDPFAGSGTTAVAAALEHRDCTLIDLDPRNVQLVDRRLRETCRIVDHHVDGNRHTWTIEPASDHELANIAAGQLGFDLDGWGDE